MRRLLHALPWLFLILLAAGLGLFAWMTQHPEAPWIEQAESWPVVGELAERFRRAYLPPPPREPAEPSETEVEVIRIGGPEETEPPPPNPVWVTRVEPVWLEPGMTVHEGPDAGSAVVAELSLYREVLPRAVRGTWYRVELGGAEGWVEIDRRPVAGEPLLGSAAAPVLPVPARPPDPVRLARARSLLGGEIDGRLGPYAFFTDVRDLVLTTRLDRVGDSFEGAYRRRFGLEPVGRPAEAVVLFSEEPAYRAFQGSERRLADLPARGHAGHGIVALYAGRREPDEVAAVLVHELTHLVNRRALGPALPPWLDEGLAEDLAWSRIDDRGRLLPGTWGGVEIEGHGVIHRLGGLAAPGRYLEARRLGDLVPLEDLVTMEWGEFVRGQGLPYVQAGLLVRYLLERGPAEGFRAFLAGTAQGEPITPERFLETLGMSFEELERGIDAWVVELAAPA